MQIGVKCKIIIKYITNNSIIYILKLNKKKEKKSSKANI